MLSNSWPCRECGEGAVFPLRQNWQLPFLAPSHFQVFHFKKLSGFPQELSLTKSLGALICSLEKEQLESMSQPCTGIPTQASPRWPKPAEPEQRDSLDFLQVLHFQQDSSKIYQAWISNLVVAQTLKKRWKVVL